MAPLRMDYASAVRTPNQTQPEEPMAPSNEHNSASPAKISQGPEPVATITPGTDLIKKSLPSEQSHPTLVLLAEIQKNPPVKILFPIGKLSLKWLTVGNVGAGLQNIGNTCYANAVMQCMTHTAPFTNYLLTKEHAKTCSGNISCTLCILQSHVSLALCNSGRVVVPTDIIDHLPDIAKHFRYGSQEDAHEFFSHLLEAMQKCCLRGFPNLDRHTQTTTFIHEVFGGCLRSRVNCLNCNANSDTFSDFFDLSLEIKSAYHVNNALEHFVRPEHLCGENAYNCSGCNQYVSATKRLTIYKLPNVLTLTLMRFDIFTATKITKEIQYPEFLNVRQYTSNSRGKPVFYSLYAVLVHTGERCNTGHYYCYVKASNDQWYKMNDSTVSRADIRTVLSQQAYLLFYVRSPDVQNKSQLHQSTGQNSTQPSRSHNGGGTKSPQLYDFIKPQLNKNSKKKKNRKN